MSITNCPECNQPFEGKYAARSLAVHRRFKHGVKGTSERTRQVRRRATKKARRVVAKRAHPLDLKGAHAKLCEGLAQRVRMLKDLLAEAQAALKVAVGIKV